VSWNGLPDADRRARCERDVADYQARLLEAETGCTVRPSERPARFEAERPGALAIGTAEEIRAWHRDSLAAREP
jgi:hypothetical protein